MSQTPLRCHNCGNDNLIHGLTLTKVNIMQYKPGPSTGMEPLSNSNVWAVYLCPMCNAMYPYPKYYPANTGLSRIYQQLFDWCDTRAKNIKSIYDAADQIQSIIKANKELVGLPGLQKDELIQNMLGPIKDELAELRKKVANRKGGRPRICRAPGCKHKAESEELFCKIHLKGD